MSAPTSSTQNTSASSTQMGAHTPVHGKFTEPSALRHSSTAHGVQHQGSEVVSTRRPVQVKTHERPLVAHHHSWHVRDAWRDV